LPSASDKEGDDQQGVPNHKKGSGATKNAQQGVVKDTSDYCITDTRREDGQKRFSGPDLDLTEERPFKNEEPQTHGGR